MPIAIQVVVTSGGIPELLACQRLKIAEVWFWEKEILSIYQLTADGYQLSEKSIILPDLNISLLTDCMKMTSHLQSLQQFRQIHNQQNK
jgi:hypothetical protein